MVSFKPKFRPSADEILNHAWFNEIKEMKKEQLENIEKEIRDEFMKLVDEVRDLNQKKIEKENIILKYPAIINQVHMKLMIHIKI